MHLRKHIGGRREGDGEERGGGAKGREIADCVCACVLVRACVRKRVMDRECSSYVIQIRLFIFVVSCAVL